MGKLLIIHPQDSTTDFLNPIWSFISNQFGENITIRNISFSDEEHTKVKDEIIKYDGKNILFLGHGNSTHLMGAKSQNYSCDTFINRDELLLFKSKTVLSFSCKSSDYLRFVKDFSYIGFDDIPSDMTEVVGARELEHDIYPDVNEDVINEFRKIMVRIVANSVYDWIESDYDIERLYNRLKIRIDKEIVGLLNGSDKNKFRIATVGLLNKLKRDMRYFKHKN